MSETILRTSIGRNQINTPLLVANEAHINKFSFNNIENIQAKNGFIENLTIKELTVLDEEAGNDDFNETYEDVSFNDIVLNFGDEYNCRYLRVDHNSLTSEEGGLMAEINFEVPVELGTKLVCRYLILDLRELSSDTNVGVMWPTQSIKWMYGVPDIEAGYFYVLAFQRFAKDLIIGNVAVKVEGHNI